MIDFKSILVPISFGIIAVINTASVFYPRLLIKNALPGNSWVSDRFIVPIGVWALGCALGLYSGLMNGYGAMIFGLFAWCCVLFHAAGAFEQGVLYHKTVKNRDVPIVSAMAFFGIVIIFFGVLHHKWPGFFNVCVLSQYTVSEHSVPYTMWFNFDRTVLAMMLCMYGVHCPKPSESFHRKKGTVFWISAGFAATVTVVVLCGLGIGYIEWDIKWPSILGLWSLNNIFFVCFIEEVWFRGFLQGRIKQGFTRLLSPNIMGYRPHILAASVIFGMDHAIKGGPVYGALAMLVGLFYGAVYDGTGRIQYAWAVHFLFNLLHIILFTYPASTGILSR
jgi:membrane protease YdiL (CAAX protease family)